MVAFEDRAEDVDLGLSVRWARFNVNCTKHTSKQFLFAWGEQTPYTTDDSYLQHLQPKRYFTWTTYFDTESIEDRNYGTEVRFKEI